MNAKFFLLAAAALPCGAWADEPQARKWKEQAEFSMVSTNGNSKATTVSAKNSLGYDFSSLSKLETQAGALGSRSQETVTAEQYYASEQVSYKVSDRNYIFEKYRWNRDRFAQVAHRHEISAGVGRELWKTPKDLLIGEAAPGYFNEQRMDAPRKDYASGRLYAKYAHQFSATAQLSQDAEYLQSLQLGKDNRLSAETALTAILTKFLSCKVSYVWKHDSRPAPGVRKDDTITAVALIATF
ncbi:MAG TPA: hypothetical protein DEB40_13260 [Elusimicrobia bacterium]|nr:hypothetical protein [Elusimicrobiota bacterium]HBT62703.1 hypothetical protein [Elusimicrobiota bacterium]